MGLEPQQNGLQGPTVPSKQALAGDGLGAPWSGGSLVTLAFCARNL